VLRQRIDIDHPAETGAFASDGSAISPSVEDGLTGIHLPSQQVQPAERASIAQEQHDQQASERNHAQRCDAQPENELAP
jgi:hypothetical protein